MNFLDLIRMSSGNLWRRKLRTILTVLGVVIGTASIVVMVSMGLALNKMMLDEIEKNGGLTTVTVTGSDGDYSSYEVVGEEEEQTSKLKITDETVEQIKQLDHVSVASPVLNSVSLIAKQGRYVGQLYQVTAMSREALESMNLEFAEGGLPAEGSSELQFIYGNQVICDFSSRKDGMPDYWVTQELPEIDFGKTMYYYFDTDGYWNSQNTDLGSDYEEGDSSDNDDTQAATPLKKYKIKTAGVLAGGPEDYYGYSYTVYCDIESFIAQLKKVFRNKAIPQQPTTKSGKPYKTIYYNSVYVRVDDIDNIEKVQQEIRDLGYKANSDSEYIKSQQKQFQTIQLILGCIGAVSLFVAAIGIANTMMMSIYERTKEIGVIKVLGCNLTNIRTLFLMEAAFIGFIGGAIGLALSYTISAILNRFGASFLGEFMMVGDGATASYIPPWLALAALIFAMLVGMIAGFFPALRAMRLSPLAAIRTE